LNLITKNGITFIINKPSSIRRNQNGLHVKEIAEAVIRW